MNYYDYYYYYISWEYYGSWTVLMCVPNGTNLLRFLYSYVSPSYHLQNNVKREH